MQQSVKNTLFLIPFKNWYWLYLILIGICLFSSCRKEKATTFFDEEKITVKFFAYPNSLDTSIKDFASEIKKQNNQYHFLNYFIYNNGYPDWQSYQKVIDNNNNVVAIIPFSFETQNEINGFIICRKSGNDKYRFALYKKDSLLTYGFSPQGGEKLNAQQVQTVLNSFNYKHFGTSTYRIPDIRMLPDSLRTKYPDNTDPAKLLGYLHTKDDQKSGFKTESMQLLCITNTEETEWWYNPDGDSANNNGDEYYLYSTFSSTTVCITTDNGGGNSAGNTTEQTVWWHGGGGAGSGPPPPQQIKDSTYYKGMLNKMSLAIGRVSDSVFNLAQVQKFEYSFIITEKGAVNYTRNIKTDNDPDAVRMIYTTSNGEALKGEGHTHQDDAANGKPQDRCSLDMGDVYALLANANFSKQDFVSFVDMGDVRQVIVIENIVKARAFINALKNTDYWDTWVTAATTSPLTGSNYRQATLNATLAQLGNSAISGIGFYQTTDTNKLLFTKLN